MHAYVSLAALPGRLGGLCGPRGGLRTRLELGSSEAPGSAAGALAVMLPLAVIDPYLGWFAAERRGTAAARMPTLLVEEALRARRALQFSSPMHRRAGFYVHIQGVVGRAPTSTTSARPVNGDRLTLR